MLKTSLKRISICMLLLLPIFWAVSKSVFAQTSPSVLYVPLIGITSVPEPLALPKGEGNVTYKYAVKNFLPEIALTGIRVVDNKCSTVRFVEGDDNHDLRLDYSETWRYTCTTKLSTTTQSIATATGIANSITATHKAYTTVAVGSNNPPPLVSIVNVTKVAYPLSLPAEGGPITFTYRVNNPGIVPLSDVAVTDDKCSAMSGRLGDTNGNNLLDINETWIYTCTTILKETTTNTVNVSAYSNSLKAVGEATITIKVDTPAGTSPLFDVVISPILGEGGNFKIITWTVLLGVLMSLIVFFVSTSKKKFVKRRR